MPRAMPVHERCERSLSTIWHWRTELFGNCALFRGQQGVDLDLCPDAGHYHLCNQLSLARGNSPYFSFIELCRQFHLAEPFPINLQFLL